MSDPMDPLRFRFEAGELNLSALIEIIRKLLLGLPDLAVLRAAASPGFWVSTSRELAGMVRNLANVSVGDALTGGWQQHVRFAQYTDPKAFPPEKVSKVPLASHHIKSTYKPHIDILVDGAASGAIPLELSLDLLLEGAILVIQNGRFMRLDAGRARVTAALQLADATICKLCTRDYDWAKGVSFGERGVPITTVL
jgi:hypothetical protein